MTPTPKTKAEDILQKVSALARDRSKLNEIMLATLKREAKSSLNIDAFHGYMALGALAALSWNDADVDESHRRAINLSDSELSHRNYSVSLHAVLRYDESAEQAILASKCEPENLTALRMAIQYATLAGRVNTAMNLNNQLISRTSKGTPSDFDVEAINKVLISAAVDESEFINGQRIVCEILRKHHALPENISIGVDEDPSEPSILVEYQLDTDYQTAQTINNEVSARLCEKLLDGGHPAVLMFGIVGNQPSA